MFPGTIIHGIFETSSGFHVGWRTAGRVYASIIQTKSFFSCVGIEATRIYHVHK